MTTSRPAKRLFDLEIDEISLVDRPANQHAEVAIAKRDEDSMTVIDAEGREVSDLSQLEPGGIYFDADSGEALVACEEGAEPEDYYSEDDLNSLYAGAEDEANAGELVGKASPLQSKAVAGYISGAGHLSRNKKVYAAGGAGLLGGGVAGMAAKSLGGEVYEQLSKALGDDQRNEVVSKALQDANDRVTRAEAAALQATRIAKGLAEQLDTERLTEITKSYGVPGRPEDLAEIFKSLNSTQAQYLDQVLSSVGEQLFESRGADLPEHAGSIHGQIEAMAGEAVGKSDVTAEAAISALYAANPDAYDAFLAESY